MGFCQHEASDCREKKSELAGMIRAHRTKAAALADALVAIQDVVAAGGPIDADWLMGHCREAIVAYEKPAEAVTP